jgi:ring-1,2-phenylacetyl-CoA epoxidase subunit PaaA
MVLAEGPKAATDEELIKRLEAGYKISSVEEMSPRYREAISTLTLIAADLETSVLGILYEVFDKAPDLEAKIAIATSIQDEMGHGLAMYQLLEDFGHDIHKLVFERDPTKFKGFYVTQFRARDYIEFIVTQAIGDRAGMETTTDLEEHCSYLPYSRSLRKINFEEGYHVAHGRKEIRRLWDTGDPEIRARIQRVFDWAWPLYVEWFGVPDAMKTRTDQLTFKIRGRSNDEMRRRWMQDTCEFADSVGIKLPAHKNEKDEWVIDYELPILLDEEKMVWDFDNTVTWEEKFAQWKKGGPHRGQQYELVQSERWGDDLWQA